MTRAQARLELTDTRHIAGYCAKCGKWALLCVKEGQPLGDQETYYVGTDCCGAEIEESQ